MKELKPIMTTELFPELRQHLLSLLNSLTPEEWDRPTLARKWTVKDVALHLLGDDIGVLSRKRDGHVFRLTAFQTGTNSWRLSTG